MVKRTPLTLNHQNIPAIDLDAASWEAIKQAAVESNWIPPGYMQNEWVADVCSFLRGDPPLQHQASGAQQPVEPELWMNVETGGIEHSHKSWMGPEWVGMVRAQPAQTAQATAQPGAEAVPSEALMAAIRKAKPEWAKMDPSLVAAYIRDTTMFEADMIEDLLQFAIDVAAASGSKQ